MSSPSSSMSLTSMSMSMASSFSSTSSLSGLDSLRKVVGPAFVFVVDTCTAEEELGALKNELLLVVEQLPENALVGLVTFDSMVRVHDLGFSECSRVVLFHGEREISSEQVLIIMFNNATHTSMLRHCFYRTPITTCQLNNCKKKSEIWCAFGCVSFNMF